ncbi:MAG TPA: TRAM domain-containing protein [Lichenihabitans sp.]|jgi:23S rRNA (uracil1939-C5)-methyltransferase|nr:TRAM domain-containing protein [Lichenihabitans sp.]
MLDPIRLRVESLGRRGEGVARRDGRAVYVPFALPGETVLADVDGERGHLRSVLEARPDRRRPLCPYYGTCGGCAVQTLSPEPYAAWKRGIVVAALRHAGLEAEVSDLVDAHGEGRRRATFHVRFGARPRDMHLGFMEARSHRIVDIDACPVLAPCLSGAVPAARRIAGVLYETGKPLDILITATDGGLDLDLRGLGRADETLTRRLIAIAGEIGLARLSNRGEVLVERCAPTLSMGRAIVALPPGAFLQATAAGEAALAALVIEGVGSARHVADLFSGVGTFALRLAERAGVSAWDNEPRAIVALDRAARTAAGLRAVAATVRDLIARPLLPEELTGVEAIVFDPPRAGADAQANHIARSGVPSVVAVSCDAGTFARDAATLVAGGYAIERVTPVDQFRHAAHVEIVAVFRRRKAATRRRRLLG